MFVDLMHDIRNTFADRFLKVQLVFEQAAAAASAARPGAVEAEETVQCPRHPRRRAGAVGRRRERCAGGCR